MKRLVRCLLLCALGATQLAFASGVVRIADDDCAGLNAAVTASAGQVPTLIVLASKGHYVCDLGASGNITIDGAGSTIVLRNEVSYLGITNIDVTSGGFLTLRNVNLTPAAATTATAKAVATAPPIQPQFPLLQAMPIQNDGTLVLENVSVSGFNFTLGGITIPFALISNTGNLILRNASFVSNAADSQIALIGNSGKVQVWQSTFALNQATAFASYAPGTITISNSLVASSGAPNCASHDNNVAGEFVSLGGNVISDSSCGFHGVGDQTGVNPGVAGFGDHGGLVQTLALNDNSPAIHNGIAANCEAADARGKSRGENHCDVGAYEFGGGEGRLDQSGMSGLYFVPSNDGHYITVQRLEGNNALVIWNTFDEAGVPAWLYGVGSVSGTTIHVPQVAANLGGVLHPGGAVTGAKPTLWGAFDLDLPNCLSAKLNYQSVLPTFGSGTVDLQRLVFVGGVDCSQ